LPLTAAYIQEINMLKKFTWIAALLAALAMVFAGCSNFGSLDDESGPKPAEDLEIAGADITLIAIGDKSSTVTIEKNKVTLKGTTSAGFYYEFPPEAAEYTNFEVYIKVLEIKKGRPGLLIKRNTKMDNPIGTSGDNDPTYQMNDGDGGIKEGGFKFEEGETYSTGVWKKNKFEGGIGFQHQAWNPANNDDAEYTIEVTLVVFIGGGAAPTPPPPEYKGAAGRVVFTEGAATDNRLDDVIVDSDPSVIGAAGMTISSTGVVSMKKDSVLHYKFPTSALVGTKATAVDIEKDFDYIDIEYTISNVVKTSGGAGNLKARIYQYDSAVDYTYEGGSWADLGGAGTNAYQLQTWGAGGTGGFSISYNNYDIATEGADSLDIKITKVTFSTGERFKVQFFTPQTPNLNNIAAVEVLDGNGLEAYLPKVANPGWTFLGWSDKWDPDTGNGVTPAGGGTYYSASTPVESNLVLYATWLYQRPKEVTVTAGTDWAPSGLTYGNGTSVLTDGDGKKWQLMGPRSTSQAGNSTNQPGFDYFTGQGYGAEVRFTFTEVDENAFAFDTLKVTIVARKLTAAEIAARKASDTAFAVTDDYEDAAMGLTCKIRTGEYNQGADKGYPQWEADEDGEEKVLTYNVADFNDGNKFAGLFYVFNDWQWDKDNAKAAPFLIRIEKIEFLYE